MAQTPRGPQRLAKKLDVSKATKEQKELILEYAAEARRFEIERFWQRSTFFWTFIGAALVSFGVLYPSKSARLLTIVTAFGGLARLAWTLQNRGSKYWQEAWEQKVEAVENDVLGTNLFQNREELQSKGIWGAADFSVSRLATLMSDMTVALWFFLSITAMSLRHDARDMKFGAVVVLIALCIGVAMSRIMHTNWDKTTPAQP